MPLLSTNKMPVSAALDRRPATLRFRPLRRNQSPQFIRYKRCCHAPSTHRHLHSSRFC
jgi:hypothetical protein